jgi:3-phenylpropionate/trans-cinnamate dioxygenase ferredoxin reductase subunit
MRSSTDGGVVIVGGGQAAAQLAASLRENGFEETISIVAAEQELPYQRPPLSKAYLKGEVSTESLELRPAKFYADQRITLHLGEAAVSIDRRARRLCLSSGIALPYAHLVLATGSRNRDLAVPGARLAGVLSLRSRVEADLIRQRVGDAQRVVVIGAGFVGLELACVLHSFGKAVTVLEAAPRPLGRAVSQSMADHLARSHAECGIEIVTGAAVKALRGVDGHVRSVELAGGRAVAADLVLVGIGAGAETSLAAACDLSVSNGIDVDDHLATADPAISAIGDCANVWRGGRALRLESVQNAVDQARCLAARLAGRPQAYGAVPWFWSDQGAQRLQIAGLVHAAEIFVPRGDPASSRFSIFAFAGDRLVGVESVNRPADHMLARRLLAAGIALTPDEAADPSCDLKARLVAN